MVFLVAETHPFADGTGRVARLPRRGMFGGLQVPILVGVRRW